MKKTVRILFGIILVAVGVIAALSALGIINISPLPEGVTVWRILIGALMLFFVVHELVRLNFTGTMLLLWVEFTIFKRHLGIMLGRGEDFMSTWLALLIALLIGIGIDWILKGLNIKKKYRFTHINSTSFVGDSLKYVDSANFNYQRFSNRFGDLEIRFENAELYCGGGKLELHNSFGDIKVYVPRDWDVVCDINNSFADLSVSHEFDSHYADGSGKTIRITGENKFGDVYIKAI